LNPLAGSTNSVMAKAASYFPGDDALLTTATQASALDARLASRLLSLHYFRVGDDVAFARELRHYHDVIGVDPVATDLLLQAMSGALLKSDLAPRLEPLGIARDAYFARELALLGMPAETMAAMLRRPASESAFLSDIWLPEFKAVRALPEFVDFIRSIGVHNYWRNHGMPDVCAGDDPEPFCSQFVDSAGI